MVQAFKNVGIIGAGISGLTAAIALLRRGAQVHIFERSSSLTEAGAGIWVPPNGMRILASLGIADEVKRSGIEIDFAELHDYRAGLLRTLETRSTGGWTNVAIHRQTLQRILREHAPTGAIHFGHELVEFVQEQNLVSLRFANSTTHCTTIVLGADGIHSAVRRCLFPETKLRYSGQTSWRAVVSFDAPLDSFHKSIEIWAPGARFGYSAISADQVYWYATADAPPGQSESAERAKERLVRMAGVFPTPIRDLVSVTPPEAIFRTDLWDLPGLTNWHRQRVMLLGDAAHAATPNLGQGGAQAMEDAWILAKELAAASDVSRAFLDFEHKRIRRTQSVVRMAWRLGKAAHMSGFRRSLRNLTLRAMPDAIIRSQINALYNGALTATDR